MRRGHTLIAVASLAFFHLATHDGAQDATPPTTAPAATQPQLKADDLAAAAKTGKLPFVQIDVAKKQVRVEAETIGCQAPLEFFCVVSGTSEHESIFRSDARPAHVHLGLLMIGLEPGEPVHFDERHKKWLPPHGPPLKVTCEWTGADGKLVSVPAHRLMCDQHTKKEMPEMTWIFSGSRVMPDGVYGADVTGYTMSIVNFELAMIDVPELASSANETLEWVANNDLVPPPRTKVTLVIEPAPKVIAPATQPAGSGATTAPATTQPAEPRDVAPF